MDFESIDGLFRGTGSVEVVSEAVAPAPEAPVVTGPPGGANPPRLAFVPPQPAAPLTPEPAPAEPAAAPAAAVPAAPTPVPGMPSRIATSQFEPEAQQAIDLQHTLNAGKRPGDTGFVPLTKCFEMLGTAAAPAAPPVPAGPSPLDLANTKIVEVQSQLKELRAKRAELAEFGSDLGDLDSQIESTTSDLMSATASAAVARVLQDRDSQDAQLSQHASENRARLATEAAVAKVYPTVVDKASPLGSKVNQLATAMQNPNHPDHSLLHSLNAAAFVTDSAAVLVAQDMEAMQGIPFAQALASLRAAPAPVAVAAVPGQIENQERRILPAPGGLGTSQPAPAPTSSEIMADVGFDPDKIDAALYGGQKAWHIGG